MLKASYVASRDPRACCVRAAPRGHARRRRTPTTALAYHRPTGMPTGRACARRPSLNPLPSMSSISIRSAHHGMRRVSIKTLQRSSARPRHGTRAPTPRMPFCHLDLRDRPIAAHAPTRMPLACHSHATLPAPPEPFCQKRCQARVTLLPSYPPRIHSVSTLSFGRVATEGTVERHGGALAHAGDARHK